MIRVIEIVTGGWDVFIGLALLICSFTISFKENQDQKDTSYKNLLFANLILQVSDLLAWIFRGNGTTLGFYMVRISNFWFYIGMAAVPWTASRFIYYQVKDSFPDTGKLFSKSRDVSGTGNRNNKNQNIPDTGNRNSKNQNTSDTANHSDKNQNALDTGKHFIKIQNALAIGSILLININVFTGILYTFDEHNFYQREPGLLFLVFNGLAYASMILIHAFAWKYRKNRNATITRIVRFTCLLVEVAGTYQVLFYGISAFNIACTAGMLLLFTGILRQRSEIQRMEQAQLEESRQELAETRQQMLQLQIQPHFMYNTIAAIQAQVLEDQEAAYESIGTFSAFMRDTIHYSRMDQAIMMEEELAFAEKFLELAQMRFGDRLNVELEIEESAFYVPPFTIQPLVENALNHGLKPLGHEGTIYIRTYKKAEDDQTFYYLEVEDNGIGIDPGRLESLKASLRDNLQGSLIKDKGKTHIGMLNVKQRIEMACQGQLEIVSPVVEDLPKERKGTIIRIRIPEKRG